MLLMIDSASLFVNCGHNYADLCTANVSHFYGFQGAWSSGKTLVFGTSRRRFESCRPCSFVFGGINERSNLYREFKP